jgi:hypothetical protein
VEQKKFVIFDLSRYKGEAPGLNEKMYDYVNEPQEILKTDFKGYISIKKDPRWKWNKSWVVDYFETYEEAEDFMENEIVDFSCFERMGVKKINK